MFPGIPTDKPTADPQWSEEGDGDLPVSSGVAGQRCPLVFACDDTASIPRLKIQEDVFIPREIAMQQLQVVKWKSEIR